MALWNKVPVDHARVPALAGNILDLDEFDPIRLLQDGNGVPCSSHHRVSKISFFSKGGRGRWGVRGGEACVLNDARYGLLTWAIDASENLCPVRKP